MKTLDPHQLVAVTGGYVTRRATPEQMDTFNRCADAARQKSVVKPWTWGSPTTRDCFRNLIDGVRKNPPEISV